MSKRQPNPADVFTNWANDMTTERQHTLVPCATCGTGDQPKHMVSVGDDWLCTQCAGSQIHTLRTRLSNYERKDLVATLGSEEKADRYLAFINQPNPEPPRPRRKEQRGTGTTRPSLPTQRHGGCR